MTCNKYTLWATKKMCHFQFYDNFEKCRRENFIITVAFRSELRRKVDLNLPPGLLHSTLRNLSFQLYSFSSILVISAQRYIVRREFQFKMVNQQAFVLYEFILLVL